MEFAPLEEQVIKRWRAIKAFEKSVLLRPKNKRFVFYEGPPTANGMPGLHHILARSFKDVMCRYKTMRGYRVERRAGWDTHGLPVEIQVEKELGFKNKKDIEEYGIAKFNQRCRDSVWRYRQEWEHLTERMGYWVDVSDPYTTYDPLYMESLFWVLSQAFKKDILYEGYRVSPFCTRCGTSLSSHEVAQGYEDVVDQSVFVRFRVHNTQSDTIPEGTSILVWTTTPWTLPANIALAVGEKIPYAVVEQENEHFIIAEEQVSVLGDSFKKIRTISGKDLVGLRYDPPFDALREHSDTDEAFCVYGADFVTTGEGTGVVHIAPPYGDDDYQLALKHGLPVVHTVNLDGAFNNLVKGWKGKNAKESDSLIIDALKKRSLLYKKERYKHSYPFCWRCSLPLIYYARHSWFLRMSALKDDLIEANNAINWVPQHIKNGRFGEWLVDVKDWALSRSRYWGTPLPIWRCDAQECDALSVLGSRKDIAEATKGRNSYILVRHGETAKNSKGLFAGDYPESVEYDLLPRGSKVVQKTAEDIQKKGGIDIIFTSPFLRTRQTADIISKQLGGVEVIVDKRLAETRHGVWEGKSVRLLDEEYPDLRKMFVDAPKGAETFTQVQKRVVRFIQDLEKKYSGKKIALVSHGDPLFLLEKAIQGWTVDETITRLDALKLSPGAYKVCSYAQFPINDKGDLDFHRPYIDDITFSCKKCDTGVMRREPYLADVWFDSGAMPYASTHYPFQRKQQIEKGEVFPADYISEAVDQTRGWFYTLLAVSTMVQSPNVTTPPFRNGISLGHVLDSKGKKMSKSKGNIVDPILLADKYGMDAVRWYFFTVNNPGDVKRFTEKDVAQAQRTSIALFYNSFLFVRTYAPNETVPSRAPRADSVLERWILIRLGEVALSVATFLDEYDVMNAARTLEDFIVNDLSRWYIRRSRNAFQRPSSSQELRKRARVALWVLSETAQLLAPFTPFIAEEVWQSIHNTQKQSVHWEEWKIRKEMTKQDKTILSSMHSIRLYAQAVLRVRAEHKIRVRQPLSAVILPRHVSSAFSNLLREEVNVESIVKEKYHNGSWKYDEEHDVGLDIRLTPELKHEGMIRECIRRIQEARKTLGLHASDDIAIYYRVPQQVADIFDGDKERIASETGARTLEEGVSHLHNEVKVEVPVNDKDVVMFSIAPFV
ncbi:MAG: class I tRNA ligase family protein [Candidatus Spechtbacteria bacterium SB0662_bin_43]|uniref:isoleucine--tRNA ligase n=1 Tax=Candidatus Spechtbacteria bacterium SB0662_bin_43 TaxID=2604897 RepID=A0A845DC02_9BACT|nr:class I tRNA ligase family protein [Candidatus Spechtbacteria bacterium SB0662_bin_43]